MSEHLNEAELQGLKRMLSRDDCTLTPFWHSRVQNLIQQIQDQNQLIDEDRALLLKILGVKP